MVPRCRRRPSSRTARRANLFQYRIRPRKSALRDCRDIDHANRSEIGTKLFISESTVKGHLRNIFTKLNVLSRTEAITAATRRGVVQLVIAPTHSANV